MSQKLPLIRPENRISDNALTCKGNQFVCDDFRKPEPNWLCPDSLWCLGNNLCYWDCHADPDAGLIEVSKLQREAVDKVRCRLAAEQTA